MHTINPEAFKEAQIRVRTASMNLLPTVVDMLHARWTQRREVSWGMFDKLVKHLLIIGQHRRANHEYAQKLESKVVSCGVDSYTVHVDDNRIYIEGYFDINKLQKELLW